MKCMLKLRDDRQTTQFSTSGNEYTVVLMMMMMMMMMMSIIMFSIVISFLISHRF